MHNANKNTSKIERFLQTYYQAPEPSKLFLETLEQQLKVASQNVHPISKRTNWLGTLAEQLFGRRTRWAAAPILVVLLLAIIVITAGPEQVLAEVKSWLRYVPGYGYMDTNNSLALAKPVSQTQGNTTVTIKQVLLRPGEETHIVISLESDFTEEELRDYLGHPDPENFSEEKFNAYLKKQRELYETDARLILPDGSVVENTGFGAGPWEGFFIFPELPDQFLSATLEVTRLAGVPAGRLPENWRFELTFESIDEPRFLVFPEPQEINVHSEIVHGISAHVLDVVYAPTETSIRVHLDNLPTGWKPLFTHLDRKLTDNLGNEYPIIYGPQDGLGLDGIFIESFQPIANDTEQLTLTIPVLHFQIPLDNQSIRIDFGENPQIGDVIPLDEQITVLGNQLNFLSVTIQDGGYQPIATEKVNGVNFTEFVFEIEIPATRDGTEVIGLEFAPLVFEMLGSEFGLSTGGVEPDQNTLTQTLGIQAAETLPNGVYEFPLQNAQIKIDGPYSATWSIEK